MKSVTSATGGLDFSAVSLPQYLCGAGKTQSFLDDSHIFIAWCLYIEEARVFFAFTMTPYLDRSTGREKAENPGKQASSESACSRRRLCDITLIDAPNSDIRSLLKTTVSRSAVEIQSQDQDRVTLL